MYSGEKKTVIYVLLLYLSSTLLLIGTFFTGYYFYQKEQIAHNEKEILKKYTLALEEKLSILHEQSSKKLKYPRFEEFKSAIYDIDKNLLFTTMDENIGQEIRDLDKEFFKKDSKSYLISSLTPYYLGAAYIVIQKNTKEMNILGDLIYMAILSITIAVVTSVFLVNLVLKPLRKNIKLLDDFIKDTTHELNTPITAILTNIETIDSTNCDEKSLRKLQRIKTASTSISNLYEDLVYLLLHQKTSTQNEDIDLSEMLFQRVNYFSNNANLKKISFILNIKKNVRFIADRQKFERLIDNILSNAIKYTKKSTKITVILNDSMLCIQDEGKGMSKEEINTIFERYRRFDKTQGGFGIGYSIIKSITDEYGIHIDISSKIDEGTKVTLTW